MEMNVMSEILTFGRWTKQERERKRMTKTECALRAGVSIQRWAQIEYDESNRRDNKPPRIERETVEWVARGLQVQVDEAMIRARLLPEDKLETVVREVTASGQYDAVTFDNAGAGIRSVQGEAIQVQIPEDQLEVLKQFNANFAAMMQKMTKTE
jgi:transcriptional regulator with XRE-family HTH domain